MLLLRFDLRIPPFVEDLTPARQYGEMLDMVRFADAHGFAGVVLSEHHAADDGFMSAPLVVAAGVLGATRNLFCSVSALLLPLHDPIRVAEGRYLSDELTLHYGLVPRTNRGIFAINELPDLAERIQVGLLNVLEERDVQVRGYRIRLPLDVLMVATANPEDYTNRGRIITPLKDRFGSQIRTHYPLDVEVEMDVVEQEAL